MTAGAAFAQSAPAPSLPFGTWQRFVDPNEGSFQVDVPVGWHVSGGLARRNAMQMWPWLSAITPDGWTMIGLGDPGLQSYFLPTPMLAMTGFREGSIYNSGAGVTYVVSRYRTGRDFGLSYGTQALSRVCTNTRVQNATDRPDIAAKMSGSGFQTTAAEIKFTCTKGASPLVGTLYSATTLVPWPMVGPGAGIWFPSLLAGVLSPAPLEGVGEGVMAHMLDSFRINPAWEAAQSQTALDSARIMSGANQHLSSTIMQAWQSRGAALDRAMDADSRARLGIDIYTNPSTGTRYTVENRSSYYWMDPQGQVVGTDTDTPPGADFSRLQRVPPGR